MTQTTTDPQVALDRLEGAVEGGALARLAERFGLLLLVVFGSAVEGDRPPRDLDLAYEGEGSVDVVALHESLYELTGFEGTDLLDLRPAGIVARARALGRGIPLFEATSGRFAIQQIAAVTLLADTRWMRDIELEMLARWPASGSTPHVVQCRLRGLRELLGRLDELGVVDASRLRDDWRTRSIVERVLIQVVDYAVQANTHLVAATGEPPPDDYHSSFLRAADQGIIDTALAARLAPSTGLRNVLVHEYLDVDIDLIAEGFERAKADYGEYVRQVRRYLKQARQQEPEPE